MCMCTCVCVCMHIFLLRECITFTKLLNNYPIEAYIRIIIKKENVMTPHLIQPLQSNTALSVDSICLYSSLCYDCYFLKYLSDERLETTQAK